MDLQAALDKVNDLLVSDTKILLGESKSEGRSVRDEQLVVNLRRVRRPGYLNKMFLPSRLVLLYLFGMPIIYVVLKK